VSWLSEVSCKTSLAGVVDSRESDSSGRRFQVQKYCLCNKKLACNHVFMRMSGFPTLGEVDLNAAKESVL